MNVLSKTWRYVSSDCVCFRLAGGRKNLPRSWFPICVSPQSVETVPLGMPKFDQIEMVTGCWNSRGKAGTSRRGRDVPPTLLQRPQKRGLLADRELFRLRHCSHASLRGQGPRQGQAILSLMVECVGDPRITEAALPEIDRAQLLQFENACALRTLAKISANQGNVSQLPRLAIKQRAGKKARHIRGMTRPLWNFLIAQCVLN